MRVSQAVTAAVAANMLPMMQYRVKALTEAVRTLGIISRLSGPRRRVGPCIRVHRSGCPAPPGDISPTQSRSAGAPPGGGPTPEQRAVAGVRGGHRRGAGWQRQSVSRAGSARGLAGALCARGIGPLALAGGAGGDGPGAAGGRTASVAVVGRAAARGDAWASARIVMGGTGQVVAPIRVVSCRRRGRRVPLAGVLAVSSGPRVSAFQSRRGRRRGSGRRAGFREGNHWAATVMVLSALRGPPPLACAL